MLAAALWLVLAHGTSGPPACARPDPCTEPLACPQAGPDDPRTHYDVIAYRIDVRVDPAERRIEGTAALEARALRDGLEALVLDVHDGLRVRGVLGLEGPLDPDAPLEGTALSFRHEGNLLRCQLPAPAAAGDLLCVAVRYDGAPRARNDFDGFHWRETEDGQPWIGTSMQGLGAHVWWPCKASFYHPEDKPERVSLNATVPRGLVAVSNGRLTGRRPQGEDHESFHWRHPYPLETYAVTLNVAPYVALEGTLELPGLEAPVPYAWYVLPASRERARVQFAQVPEILATFSEAFGPWPFPEAKVGLVETSFWGMEHSTAVAYGSSFPAWIAEHGGKDRYASRNRWFDYILVHELAHEWWGNAVSAADWGDFWLHEGFATYAGGVYVERRDGRATADRFFAEQAAWVHPKAVLYRGAGTSSKQAFSAAIYSKGACVLNTLRHYLDDDETWWELLRTFQLRHRYGNATTEDLRALLEELSGRDWSGFFDQWVHGAGYPRLSGRVRAQDGGVLVELENPATPTGFDVPLDLAWREGDRQVTRRLWFGPGAHRERIACELPPTELEVRHLERLLGEHDVRVDRRGER